MDTCISPVPESPWLDASTSSPAVVRDQAVKVETLPLDSAFAVALLVCGFLFFNLIMFADMPAAGTTVFALTLIIVTLIYLTKSGYRQHLKSLIALGVTVMASLHFLLFDNAFIFFLTFVFAAMLFVYWVMITTGRSIDRSLSVTFVGDVVQQGFIVPFRNFGTGVVVLSRYFRDRSYSGVLLAFLGVLLFLPLLAAVISLLMSADLAFETFLTGVFSSLQLADVMPYVWQFILGIPVALYLFGLIFGDSQARHTHTITSASLGRGALIARVAPRVMIYSALLAFCFIYALFFIVQGAYLFSGFAEKLPEAFTYAEYARRGFFELCAVTGINLVVLTITHLLMRRPLGVEPRELRIITAALAGFTLLLITAALSKMLMYINTYGLTLLRVYTSWFMILLFVVFLTLFIRQLSRFNAARIIIVSFVVLFTLLSFSNVDGLVAAYNVSVYESALRTGDLERIDIEALAGLSDGALAEMYSWYQRLSEQDAVEALLRRRLERAMLSRLTWDIDADLRARSDITDFRSFSLQRREAARIRRELLAAGVMRPEPSAID